MSQGINSLAAFGTIRQPNSPTIRNPNRDFTPWTVPGRANPEALPRLYLSQKPIKKYIFF